MHSISPIFLQIVLSLYSSTGQQQTLFLFAVDSVLFQLSSHQQQEQLVGGLHLSCQAANMVHTVSHTELLQCSVNDMSEDGKHVDEILPAPCRTTLQKAFSLKDMASLVAFALLRWNLVWYGPLVLTALILRVMKVFRWPIISD